MSNDDYQVLFTLAKTEYQRGHFANAQQLCIKLLQQDAKRGDVLDLLSDIYQSCEMYEPAIELASTAIRMFPTNHVYINNLGGIYRAMGNFREALRYFQRAINLSPDHPLILINIADVLLELGELSEAESRIQRALALAPGSSFVLACLADFLRRQGRNHEAVIAYEHAIAQPAAPLKARINLALIHEEEGRLEIAQRCLAEALVADPASSVVHNNLGNVFLKQGRSADAILCFTEALRLQPTFAEAHHNLGLAYGEQQDLSSAVRHLNEATLRRPSYIEAYASLGDLYVHHGLVEAATAAYEQAASLRPSSVAVTIKRAMALPAILRSVQEMDRYRVHMHSELNRLLESDLPQLTRPDVEIGGCPFFLTYHGCNNRELKRLLAQVFEKACPSLLWTAPHCVRPRRAKRLKVGFISKFFYNHSIGKTSRGLIAELPRDSFESFALFVPPIREDEITRAIRGAAEHTLVVDAALHSARRQISELNLDILFYQDIGMEPFTYFLSFSRLAPVQCTSFGHPETTGIRSIDYYISANRYESPHADNHYSESLYKLPETGMLAYYYRPSPTTLKSRADLGLPVDRHLYVCPQTLFKLHPDVDVLFDRILKGDPLGLILLLEGPVPRYAELLRTRFKGTVSEAHQRIVFLPPLDHPTFMSLLAMSDAVLDVPHFCGYNSTLESFAVRTPVVTMPSELQRGRHTYGMYDRMDVRDCIALSQEEYVRIALRLANDQEFRHNTSATIGARSAILYEDRDVVTGFTSFFETAYADRCNA